MPTTTDPSSSGSEIFLDEPTWAALDVRDPAHRTNDAAPLPLFDAISAVVDDFAPFAIEERDRHALRVFFTSESDRDAALAAVQLACGSEVETSTATVADDEWARCSQADLRAIRVGRVVVAPPWDLPVKPQEITDIVVEILPALGFGSGHHQTTRLALLGLQQLDLGQLQVLDLGTGSGVLAIAAVKLGAARACGVDRDQDALASARDSVAVNGVAAQVELRSGDVSKLHLDQVPVLVANLTGATLTRAAAMITTLVESAGHLVLSGILTQEEEALVAAYREHADLVWRDVEDEWVGMVWRKRPVSAVDAS
jgi:ribosomal protein L11 methyltransferase